MTIGSPWWGNPARNGAEFLTGWVRHPSPAYTPPTYTPDISACTLPRPKDEPVRCADLVLAIVTLAHAFCRLHLEAVRAQEGGCAAAAAAARTRGRGQYREEGVAG